MMSDSKRIDLHVHSFFSDGVLLPSEILQRAVVKGHAAIAITDHADASNLDEIVTDTHTPGDMIDQDMARLVAAGAGLDEEETHVVTVVNPQTLVQRALSRYTQRNSQTQNPKHIIPLN